MAALGQIAFERSQTAPHAELVDEPGHDAFQEGVIGRFRISDFGFRIFACGAGRSSLDQSLFVRDFQNLLIRLLHLTGGLSVNTVAAALFDAEAAVPRELIRPHECKKIGLLTRFKQFARLGDVFVVAAQPHQQIAAAHQRGAQGRRRHAAAFRRFDEHARVTRVQRQTKHLPADGG